MPQRLTHEIINAAIAGFEEQKGKLNTQISELRNLLNGGPHSPATADEAPKPKLRKFSAAARRRMREAQRLRWAKLRGESEGTAPTEAPRPKRKLSTAAKARLVANLKKARAAKAAKAKAQKKAAPARKKAAA